MKQVDGQTEKTTPEIRCPSQTDNDDDLDDFLDDSLDDDLDDDLDGDLGDDLDDQAEQSNGITSILSPPRPPWLCQFYKVISISISNGKMDIIVLNRIKYHIEIIGIPPQTEQQTRVNHRNSLLIAQVYIYFRDNYRQVAMLLSAPQSGAHSRGAFRDAFEHLSLSIQKHTSVVTTNSILEHSELCFQKITLQDLVKHWEKSAMTNFTKELSQNTSVFQSEHMEQYSQTSNEQRHLEAVYDIRGATCISDAVFDTNI